MYVYIIGTCYKHNNIFCDVYNARRRTALYANRCGKTTSEGYYIKHVHFYNVSRFGDFANKNIGLTNCTQ